MTKPGVPKKTTFRFEARQWKDPNFCGAKLIEENSTKFSDPRCKPFSFFFFYFWIVLGFSFFVLPVLIKSPRPR